jgi:hypothetical protein
MALKRIKNQEDGAVIRWFEDKHLTGTVVHGDFPNEQELRVSNAKGSIKARGSLKNLSDEKLIKKIKQLAKNIR